MAAAAPGRLAAALERGPYVRALVWLVFLAPFFFLSYGFANWVTSLRANVPVFAWDWERSIPFVAWTIVPYWSTDLLYAASLFICRTRRGLDAHALRLLAAQVISVAAFLLFPLRFSFERPHVDGLFGTMFDALGSFDKPFNQAPSLHLSLTTILWVKYSAHLQGIPLWLMRGWLALAGIATLTTYQHHFIDLPTGVLVGLIAIGLFPDSREAWHVRLASGYSLVSIALVCAALGLRLWILLWPAAALLVVAAAYCLERPSLLGKHGRGMHPLMAILLAPYIGVAWLNSRWWTRHEDGPGAQEIADGVWLGRLPTRSQRQSGGFASIVDVTAELPALCGNTSYRNVPMLDLVLPSSDQLNAAVVAIDEFSTARPTLVCCALGYSRSAAAVSAWLVASGNAASLESAVAIIRRRRPRIVLSVAHENRLKEWTCGLPIR